MKLLLLLPLLLFAIIGCSENPVSVGTVETEPVESVESKEGVPVNYITMYDGTANRLQKTAASGRVGIKFILKNEYTPDWVGVGGLFVSVKGADGVYNSGNLDANGKFTTTSDMIFPATMRLWFDDGKNGALGHYLVDTNGAIPCFVYNNITNSGEILEAMQPGRSEIYRAWTEAMYTVYSIGAAYATVGELLNTVPNRNGGKVAIDVRPSSVRRFEYRTDQNKIYIHYLSTRDMYTKMMEICSKLSHEYGGHYYQRMYVSTPDIASDRCNTVDESYADFTQLYFGSHRYPGKNMFFDESQSGGVRGHTTFMTDMWDDYNNDLYMSQVPPDWEFRYMWPVDNITGFRFYDIVKFMRMRSPSFARNMGQFRSYMAYMCALPAGITRAMVIDYFKQFPREYIYQ